MDVQSAWPSVLVCCLVKSLTGPGHSVTSLTNPTGKTWPRPTTFHPTLKTGAYDYHRVADLAGPDNSGRVISPALMTHEDPTPVCQPVAAETMGRGERRQINRACTGLKAVQGTSRPTIRVAEPPPYQGCHATRTDGDDAHDFKSTPTTPVTWPPPYRGA